MLQSFIIVLREGFESFLLVAVIFSYLRRSGQKKLSSAVYAAIIAAVGISGALGYLLFQMQTGNADSVEKYFGPRVAGFLGNEALREAVLGVIAIVMVGLALATGEPVPGPATLGLAALAGLLAVAGILGLYQGLAVGRMGVVAPVTGVIAATLPVIVGLAAQGWPWTEVVVGIILALTAVLLVSMATGPMFTSSRAGSPSPVNSRSQ